MTVPSLQYIYTPPFPLVSVRFTADGQPPIRLPVEAVTPLRSGAADFYTLKVISADAARSVPVGLRGVLTVQTTDDSPLVVEGGRTFVVVSNLPGWESGGPVYWQVVLANVKA